MVVDVPQAYYYSPAILQPADAIANFKHQILENSASNIRKESGDPIK